MSWTSPGVCQFRSCFICHWATKWVMYCTKGRFSLMLLSGILQNDEWNPIDLLGFHLWKRPMSLNSLPKDGQRHECRRTKSSTHLSYQFFSIMLFKEDLINKIWKYYLTKVVTRYLCKKVRAKHFFTKVCFFIRKYLYLDQPYL